MAAITASTSCRLKGSLKRFTAVTVDFVLVRAIAFHGHGGGCAALYRGARRALDRAVHRELVGVAGLPDGREPATDFLEHRILLFHVLRPAPALRHLEL